MFDDKISYLNQKMISLMKKNITFRHPDFIVDTTAFFPEVPDNTSEKYSGLIKKHLLDTSNSENLNEDNIGIILQYHLNKGNAEKALEVYFLYDRKQQFSGFNSPKPVTGFISTTLNQYYSWTWSQNNIKFSKIKKDEITKSVSDNNQNVFYLPAKNTETAELIISRENKSKFYIANASNTFLSSREETRTTNWDTGDNLENSPGFSILKMYGGTRNTSALPSVFGYYNTYEQKSSIQYYNSPYDTPILSDSFPVYNFNIVFTQNSSLNIYLILIKEFTKEYSQTNDHPIIVFDKVFKQMEKTYGQISDLDYIYILQR
jgi:hypothetical protein